MVKQDLCYSSGKNKWEIFNGIKFVFIRSSGNKDFNVVVLLSHLMNFNLFLNLFLGFIILDKNI
jgi:hypothetical protein